MASHHDFTAYLQIWVAALESRDDTAGTFSPIRAASLRHVRLFHVQLNRQIASPAFRDALRVATVPPRLCALPVCVGVLMCFCCIFF